MGCGSSTAQQTDVKEAVAPKGHGKHGNQSSAEKPAADAHALAPHSSHSHKHDKHGHGQGHEDKKESPEVTKKKMVSRASSDASKQRVHHGAAAPTCELDPKHTAVIWCSSCEHNLCLSCDETAHSNARAAVHHRNWIETGEPRLAGQQSPPHQAGAEAGKKSKFVLKEHDVHPHETAASQQRQKFNVEKFPSPTSSTSGPHKHNHKHVEESPNADAPPPTALSAAITNMPENAHVLNALSEDQLMHLSQAELDALFNRYDKDHTGVLNRNEIKSLADDVIIRVIELIRADLHRKNPDLSASEIEKKVADEKVFALPGKNFQETEVEMKRRLHYSLDLNRDGKITKQEFMTQWGTFSQDQFKLHTEGQLACSIM